MKAAAGDAYLLALLGRGVKQAGKIGERHVEQPAVRELYLHGAGSEMDSGWLR